MLTVVGPLLLRGGLRDHRDIGGRRGRQPAHHRGRRRGQADPLVREGHDRPGQTGGQADSEHSRRSPQHSASSHHPFNL